ncbi:hypothetical protein PATSB16_42950 [Pandoraea thiooxydans]|uniref:DUF883 domain-containing protein n=1 Tax=Pandoraea thiooxydans TaxID=445709 RepID=A0A0G3EXC4_9BURK|nr:DUF883 family protein [Pandoraea thiooxydans]AKJ70694.2 hypothetical protein ABW99_18280 [Pandoraea thiooxydans]APR97629.1 hypothetical protein PATSB16_42950 [Pandoraea thiooxydans]
MSMSTKANHALEDGLDEARYVGRRVVRATRRAGDDVADRVRDLLDELEFALQHGKDADIDQLREALRSKLASAREDFGDARTRLRRKADFAWHEADTYVHDRPWQTIGLVAGFALLLGFVAGRS